MIGQDINAGLATTIFSQSFAIAIGCVFVLASCRAQSESKMASVTYVPFKSRTYAPVTPENIDRPQSNPTKLFAWGGEPMLTVRTAMSAAQKQGSVRFDRDMVRLKIRTPDGEMIFVDSGGCVLFSRTGLDSCRLIPDVIFASLGVLLEPLFPEWKIDEDAVRMKHTERKSDEDP